MLLAMPKQRDYSLESEERNGSMSILATDHNSTQRDALAIGESNRLDT